MHLTVVAIAVLSLGAQADRSETFDLPRYLTEIDRVSSAIESATTPEEAHAFAVALPDRWWVTTGTEVVTVDVGWIDAAIAEGVEDRARWPAVRESTTTRLATMGAIAAGDPEPRDRRAEDVLHGVLARPEFKTSPTSRWLDEQRARIGAWLMRMLSRLTGTGLGSSSVASVFAWVMSIAALAVLSLWLVRTLARRSNAARLELGATVPRRPPAREWGLRALAAARAGDIREAVRCGYHAALCRLDEQGVWNVDEARTPREYLSLLAADDPRHPVVKDLVGRFEQIWYGHRQVTIDDARKLSADLERLGCVRVSERAI